MLTTTIALLASFSGPMQVGPSAGSDQLLLVADSAHTLFTPKAAAEAVEDVLEENGFPSDDEDKLGKDD
jgi:hypothetical protein